MENMSSIVFDNLAIAIPILFVFFVIVIIYLVLLVRAIIEMLRYNVHSALLTFAFIALIPFPLILIMGIMILIIWHYHKKDILAGNVQSR